MPANKKRKVPRPGYSPLGKATRRARCNPGSCPNTWACGYYRKHRYLPTPVPDIDALERQLHLKESDAKTETKSQPEILLFAAEDSGYFLHDASGELIRDKRTGQAIPSYFPAPFDYLPCRRRTKDLLGKARGVKKRAKPLARIEVTSKPILAPSLNGNTNYVSHAENLEVLKKQLFVDLIPSEGGNKGTAGRVKTLGFKGHLDEKTYAVIPQVIPKRSEPPAKKAKRGKVVARAGSYAYKVVLADETAGGKSLLLQPFVEGTFDTDYKSTIGTSILKKELVIPGSDAKVRFIIWDMAMQAQFRRVRQTYFQNAEAGIVIFDVTRREAFEAVEQWVTEARRGSGRPDLPVILVGTNASLPGREVSHEEGVTLGKQLGLPYVENTGPPGDLLDGIFELLARILVIKQSL